MQLQFETITSLNESIGKKWTYVIRYLLVASINDWQVY
jgi:hypothetical protein